MAFPPSAGKRASNPNFIESCFRVALASASLPGMTIELRANFRDSTLACLIERIYTGLANLFIDGGRRATDTDGGDALAFDGERYSAFDADEPTRTDSQSLRQNL